MTIERPLDALAKAVADGVDRHQLIPDGVPVVLAISGGPDSGALLMGAAELAKARRWQLVAAHVDHMLRATSAHDAVLARSLAEGRGLAFEERRIDVAALARARGISVEEGGRGARYEFFHEVAAALGDEALIATGHTADDSAETVVLNLVRGTGITGLGGIPVRRGTIVRPLIGARRAYLRRAMVEAGIPFVDDESNTDPRFTRNRVRADVMPYLERLNPAIVDALLRLAALAGDDDALLTALARHELDQRRLPGTVVRLDWRDPPPRAVGRRVVRLALQSTPSLERVEALLDAAEGLGGGRRIELGRGVAGVIVERTISFTRGND